MAGRKDAESKKTKSPTRATRGRPLKQEKPTKAPLRGSKTKSSPELSPARVTRRANKSPVAKKSPARKSPTRRSPGRPSPARRPETEKVKPTPVLLVESDSDSPSEASEASHKMKLRKSISKERSYEPPVVRRSTRLNQVERVLPGKAHYEPVVRLTEFSDEDDWDVKRPGDSKKLAAPAYTSSINYLAIINALFQLAFYTGTLLILFIVCNSIECKFNLNQLEMFKNPSNYFDTTVFLTYIGFLLFVAVLLALPFGGRRIHGIPASKTTTAKLVYITNGLFAACATLSVLIALEFYQIPATEYLLNNYFKFAVSAYLAGFILAALVFGKSLYGDVTLEARKRSGFLNFMYGAQLNPRFFGILDVKMFLIRTFVLSMLIINSACFYHSIELVSGPPNEDDSTTYLDMLKSLKINASVLVLSTMLFIYMIDHFIFENTIITTYEVQHESFGLLKCLEYLPSVFWYGMMIKFASERGVQLEHWKLAVCSVVYLIGLVLYRGSNSQKHSFRENPYSPSVAGLDSIPTSQGKRLICSGYWGLVRHPNYLGDILIHLAFLPFVVCDPPCIIIYLIVLNLIARARKDNRRCRECYGSAWERYCQRVKYILIPKVY